MKVRRRNGADSLRVADSAVFKRGSVETPEGYRRNVASIGAAAEAARPQFAA